ncbi:MAG: thiamine pyrophosphate-dependent enzyme [Dehalococcoidia bacterium]|nr:thiamine pyrophosphate-dependent enzyme [Dehalococcoidia bacterium]
MIPSLEAVKAIHAHRQKALVVATMTAREEWDAISQDRSLDFPLFGCMGKASSFGLGLALAQPKRKVLVIDGDGSLLMNLGSLATVANKAPANYYHFVFEDGVYTTTGGQPIPAAGKVSFAGMARAAGYAAAYEFDNLEELVTEVGRILQQQGPVLVCLKVRHGEIPKSAPRTIQQAVKELRDLLARA